MHALLFFQIQTTESAFSDMAETFIMNAKKKVHVMSDAW